MSTRTVQALKATTSKLSQETRDKIMEFLIFIGNRCDTGAYNGNEHQFQKMMDPLLIDMIDSEAYATYRMVGRISRLPIPGPGTVDRRF